MKPTRGPTGSWLSSRAPERRSALFYLAVLLMLLASLALYQRLTDRSESPVNQVSPSQSSDANATRDEGERYLAGQGAHASEAVGTAALSAPAKLDHPLGADRNILKAFGEVYEGYGDWRLYTGNAIAARPGEPVMAASAGTVLVAETDPLDGGVIEVGHGGGLVTRYAGLGRLMVAEENSVQTGTILGQVGQPGTAHRALGPHLYFQVLLDGDPIDPHTRFQK